MKTIKCDYCDEKKDDISFGMPNDWAKVEVEKEDSMEDEIRHLCPKCWNDVQGVLEDRIAQNVIDPER